MGACAARGVLQQGAVASSLELHVLLRNTQAGVWAAYCSSWACEGVVMTSAPTGLILSLCCMPKR